MLEHVDVDGNCEYAHLKQGLGLKGAVAEHLMFNITKVAILHRLRC